MEPTQTVLIGDVREQLRTLPDKSVHMCCTSPPYWGLRNYNTRPQTWADGWVGELGAEPTPDMYVNHLVEITDEIWRVLRDDGTFWLNLGDCYTSGGRTTRATDKKLPKREMSYRAPTPAGLKEKELVGIPWMAAFAIRGSGWYLRMENVWAKVNVMPESVKDRTTRSHESMFVFTKTPSYYYDKYAALEPLAESSAGRYKYGFGGNKNTTLKETDKPTSVVGTRYPGEGRNKRSVWFLATTPFPGAHYAVFPPKLIEPCILLSTSEAGCCATCGAPYKRVTERGELVMANGRSGNPHSSDYGKRMHGLDDLGGVEQETGAGFGSRETTTTGWKSSCSCPSDFVPCTILDPFAGSGTTLAVSKVLGRNSIGIDLDPRLSEWLPEREQAVLRALAK
jgi:DNA modification methylase